MKQVISRKYPIPSLVEVGQARHDVSKHIYICIYPYRFTMLYIYICACIYHTYISSPRIFHPPFLAPYTKKIHHLRGMSTGDVAREASGSSATSFGRLCFKTCRLRGGKPNQPEPKPRNQVWLDMGPSRAKNEVFFSQTLFFLFNDDLICIYFIDTKKNLGELSCWIEVSFGLEESETPFSGLSNHMRQSKTQTY